MSETRLTFVCGIWPTSVYETWLTFISETDSLMSVRHAVPDQCVCVWHPLAHFLFTHAQSLYVARLCVCLSSFLCLCLCLCLYTCTRMCVCICVCVCVSVRRRSNVFMEAVVVEKGWVAPTFPKVWHTFSLSCFLILSLSHTHAYVPICVYLIRW